jgi:hypothetical protein
VWQESPPHWYGTYVVAAKLGIHPLTVDPDSTLTHYEWQCRINTAMWAEGEYHKAQNRKAKRKGKK